jgi:hypothetical protein
VSQGIFDFWYLLPIRVQVTCGSTDGSHVCSKGMKVQMNPLNYLHLAHPKVDVRGSQVALYFIYDKTLNLSTTMVINFQDGRWSKIIEEPMSRVLECLTDTRSNFGQDPFFVHAVYLTSALRWWNNALQSFNDQLIAYVSKPTLHLMIFCLPNNQHFLIFDYRRKNCWEKTNRQK